ncbi:hypothetical protein AMATHDRAFT_8172 [Amanita thiersii Skay4041]|uniref:FAD-binding PCMH-type domain-containing protein n=1 Tax=Amanita thiersii Skay4041 TaxID=703135 RepID=A0A2A9N9Y6_9AGAR|nr:hypothetical protein AMATHDRAFT_8172 [Amanita thiersii Skay4041]
MRLLALAASLILGLVIESTNVLAQKESSRKTIAEDTCKALKAKLGTTIVPDENSPEWAAALDAPWNLVNDGVAPTCIVFPYDHTPHVSAAMKEIVIHKAHYAVQSGGHTSMKVTVQPGLQWEEAILATESFGVAPVGGRVRDVGMGLLLGGGHSFLSPSVGFAAESYKELDVVFSNGDFITVNADNQYSDLFWALKGCASRCVMPSKPSALENIRSLSPGSPRLDWRHMASYD